MQKTITNIQIIPVKPRDGLVAFASFLFDDCFYFSSIGIHTRPKGGYRLTYPTRKTFLASYTLFHPTTKELTDSIEQQVIHKFEELQQDCNQDEYE